MNLLRRHPRARLEFWQAANGRWYWHRKVSGRVKEHGDYKLRRSLRRALKQMFPGEELRHVPEVGKGRVR